MNKVASIVLLFLSCLYFSDAAVRTHYIAANELYWNYAPSNYNYFAPEEGLFDPTTFAGTYFYSGPDRIGGTYLKVKYQAYTDDTFTEMIPDDPHLGLLGPTIWAEEGDTIEVYFKNNARFNFSIHPHAVFYTAESSGTSVPGQNYEGASVPPNGTAKYVWYAAARSAPTDEELFSSSCWVYHSNVNQAKDINAGLYGAIIITKKGKATPEGKPQEVDREFILASTIYDENDSMYTDINIAYYLGEEYVTNFELRGSFPFLLSNWMHTVNGLCFNNLPGLLMNTGERVRWYSFTEGQEFDFHSSHWHAQTLITTRGKRLDVLYTFPNYVLVADMVPDDAGVWIFHCHVDSHVASGMVTNFTVIPTEAFYEGGRNFATLYDPFIALFSTEELNYKNEYDVELPDYTLSIFNPFTSSSSSLHPYNFVNLFLFVYLLLTLM